MYMLGWAKNKKAGEGRKARKQKQESMKVEKQDSR